MKKSEIRKKILEIRKQKNSNNLIINFEKILKILEKFEKKNYLTSLPRIRKNYQMDFFQWSTKDPLKINKLGIPEPCSDLIKYPNILLVPLVAFDSHNNRIGYGGGFYDRYINRVKKDKKIITIGLAYSFQKVKEIPMKEHDMKLDFVVTEKKFK